MTRDNTVQQPTNTGETTLNPIPDLFEVAFAYVRCAAIIDRPALDPGQLGILRVRPETL